MFCIIEYTDYRKEQSIMIHGYSSSKDIAICYIMNELNKKISKYGGHIKEIESFDDIEYVNLKNTNKSEFRIFNIEKLNDDEIIYYMDNSTEDNLEKFIKDCIGSYRDFPEIYENIKNKNISEFTIEEIRNILEYLSINYENIDFGPDRYFCDSTVFAVVEVPII